MTRAIFKSFGRDGSPSRPRGRLGQPPLPFGMLAATGALPEVLADGHQLNYAVKSCLLFELP